MSAEPPATFPQQPGDVILIGSGPGVGLMKELFLALGDVAEVSLSRGRGIAQMHPNQTIGWSKLQAAPAVFAHHGL
jgi:hypothetical protein